LQLWLSSRAPALKRRSKRCASATSEATRESAQDLEFVSVALVAKPDSLELDGKLGEWPSLLPAEPRELPEPDVLKMSADRLEEVPASNPVSAASHVALTVTPHAAWIAAELRGAARDGVWLGFGAIPPDLPLIGDLMLRGGPIRPFNCEHEVIELEGDRAGEREQGPPLAPEVAKACREMVERHTAFKTSFRARFERVLRLAPEGVFERLADGSTHKVTGAELRAVRSEDATTLEVSLPVSAYPRLAEAPWEWVRLAAAPLTSATKAPLAERWVPLKLAEAVAFEPEAELRARAIATAYGTSFYPPAVSYAPATPSLLESLHRDGPSIVTPVEKQLYKRLAARGTQEVGVIDVFAQSLVFKDGDSLFLVPQTEDSYVEWTSLPEIHGVFERDALDGEKLLIAVSSRDQLPYANGYAGPEPASWTALYPMPGGVGGVEFEDTYVPIFERSPERFHNADYTELGLRGATHFPKALYEYDEKLIAMEIVWRWDAKRLKYRLKHSKRFRPKK
jgi:hypothetical protein